MKLPRFLSWKRFGLSTLLIFVTCLCIALAYVGREWRIVRERNAMRQWLAENASVVDEPHPQFIRRLLGDRRLLVMSIRRRLPPGFSRAFPEFFYSPGADPEAEN